MEETKKHEHGECCGCMSWGRHKHLVLRIVLMILILGIVFHLGVKIGEFKAEFGLGHYGYGMRMHGDGRMFFFNKMIDRDYASTTAR